MAGWPTRKARIDKSRLKGLRAQHHPPRDFGTYIEVFIPFAGTGINSFAVRNADTLKNCRRLVISRLWPDSPFDRARRRHRLIPAPKTGVARHPPRRIPACAAYARERCPLPPRQITVDLSFCRPPLRREQRQRCSRFLFRFRLFWFLSFPV